MYVRKSFTRVVGAVIFAFVLLSALFVFQGAFHECHCAEDEICAVCMGLLESKDTLCQPFACALSLPQMRFFCENYESAIGFAFTFATLVTLGVKLSD